MALRCAALAALCLVAGCGSQPRAADGPRLYLAGDNELWIVDAGAERVRHVFNSQLGPGDPPHKVLARGHRIVMGRPYGDSAFFIPSARADRVWVVDLEPGTASVRAVREVTVDGETTVPATRTPGRQGPLGAVRNGLLMEAGNGVDVWDPVRHRVVRHLRVVFGIIGAASGDVVSACSDFGCGGLRLTDVASGEVREAQAPSGFTFEPWNAAFSPSGDVLAVPIQEAGQAATQHRRLALVDVATGRLVVIAGSRVPAGYTLVAWSASGRHVFITGGDRGAHRVIVGYRMGTRRASVLDVEVGDFYDLAAT